MAILPALALIVQGYRQRWVAEDAFISLRIVDNILAGHGPVFNPGERVEAYTHPLWVGMLALLGQLGLPTDESAVALGLVLSAGGLFAAQAGALQLARASRPQSRAAFVNRSLPLGALVFVAVPVVWDFVTSGLETGLTFAWLGLAWWLLTRTCAARNPAELAHGQHLTTAFVLGLGLLVRPDLAIFSGVFLVVLCACVLRLRDGRARGRATIQLIAAAAALPLAYQVFRMGYFAALVPNTALAKEASEPRWGQGWGYAWDFLGVYYLWFPLALLLALWAIDLSRAAARRDTVVVILALAPAVAGALYALYVVRVGGDFMHGRFMLPAFFGLLLPVMMTPLPIRAQQRWTVAAGGAVAVLVVSWVVIAAFWLRVPYQQGISDAGIADERGYYIGNASRPNPITLEDYLGMRQPFARDGIDWREQAENHARVLIIEGDQWVLSTSVRSDIGVIVAVWNIGLSGYAAGPSVHVVDRHGLGDPLGSRIEITERRRPGHEKRLDPAWVVARFAAPTSEQSVGANPEAVVAAREALECGDLRDLQAAIEGPITPRRFLSNIRSAWRFHDLRIPSDPAEARERLCS